MSAGRKCVRRGWRRGSDRLDVREELAVERHEGAALGIIEIDGIFGRRGVEAVADEHVLLGPECRSRLEGTADAQEDRAGVARQAFDEVLSEGDQVERA